MRDGTLGGMGAALLADTLWDLVEPWGASVI
jgi:hypothetical protein